MQYIAHRINSVGDLSRVNKSYGAEIDIRYHENDIILHHDPFSHHIDPKPDRLKDFLRNYDLTGPLILNVKTEGVEKICIDLMNQFQIKNWFFLDLSMPYFASYTEKAYKNEIDGFSSKNLAVRFSEREPIEYALSFKNKATWVWVDCFTNLPLDLDTYTQLKRFFKICLVSPELQKHDLSLIKSFKEQIKDFDIDAVCTKRPDLWK